MKTWGALPSVIDYLTAAGHDEVAATLLRRWRLPLSEQRVDGPIDQHPDDGYSRPELALLDAVLRAEGFAELADRIDAARTAELRRLLERAESMPGFVPNERTKRILSKEDSK